MMMDIYGVRFSYASEETISGIDFTAGPGEVISILGPNGAGKTTLLKCINRVHEPASGRVEVDGTDVLSIHPREVAKLVGYVPQRAHVSGSTVFESVLIGRKPRMGADVSPADVRLAGRVMDLMGLSAISGRKVSEISGGEYQLVQIARAVVQEPRVILLDEPTSNLDSLNEGIILKAVRDECREKTVLLVSHRRSTMAVADLSFSVESGRLS